MNERMREVMERFGNRPALVRMQSVSDFYADAAPYEVRGGTAIIEVSGVLSNQRWSWGGTTYGELQDQLKFAVSDPNATSVLLNINSPGGSTDNLFETAALVASLAKVKPTCAVAATQAFSAAYLLASQCSKIYLAPTSGGVGSIGVYCGHMDYSKMLETMGIKVSLFSAGEGKVNGNPYEPLTDDAKSEIQAYVDELYGEFVGAVAAGRGMDAKSVIKLGARTYDGATKAIAAGLADMPGDIEAALKDMKASAPMAARASGKSSVASATNSSKEEKSMENEGAAVAVDTAKITADARQEGLAEAGLISDLCVLAGQPGLISGFLNDKKTVSQVRSELMDKQAKNPGQVALQTQSVPGKAGEAGEQKTEAKPWSAVLKALRLTK